MQSQKQDASFAKWKERAWRILKKRMDEAIRLESSRNPRTDKISLGRDKITLVFDPISIRLEDIYGGVFQGTYDISRTLVALSEEFQKTKVFDDDEIAAYALQKNISIDEAMFGIALRHVEADIFSKVKAGRFLHEQLQPAIKELLGELLDEAYLKGVSEYGLEVAETTKTFERFGREHIKNRKSRSSLVRPVGRPESWSKEELLEQVRTATSSQKKMPTLAKVAEAMNYGGLSGGANALGKLLKRHSIDWKTLKNEWMHSQKRT